MESVRIITIQQLSGLVTIDSGLEMGRQLVLIRGFLKKLTYEG